MPKLIVIDSQRNLNKLTSYLEDKELVAFDTETTGVIKGSEIIGFSVCADEETAFYVILKAWNANIKALVDLIEYNDVKEIITSLRSKKIIMHNGVFDCSMVENNFNVNLVDSLHTDTMVLAHLLNENRRVGLKELAKEYFGENSTEESKLMKESVLANGGKLTKDCYEMYKASPHLMAKYGAKDALLTYKLFLRLVPELYEQGLEDFFYKDETMPLLRGPIYELNTSGLKVDQTALLTLKKTLEAECLEAKDYIYEEIKEHIKEKYPATNKRNIFNIESSQHLAWLLFSRLGLEFDRLTDGGRDICKALGLRTPYKFSDKRNFISTCQQSQGTTYQPEATINGKKVRAKKVKDFWTYIAVDKDTLMKLSGKRKWIARLLEYKRKMKILNTYVLGLEEKVQYGIINPQFLLHGTTSGRFSSRNPNFQNLPRDDKRVKTCIISRPEKVFVGADYSQLEPRVFAYLSKDERLLESFKGQDDFYSVIGIPVYGKYDSVPSKEDIPNAFKVKYKGLRDDIKKFALAATYGASAPRLAKITGKSIDAIQEDLENYFEAFPGVAEMMKEAHRLAKKDGQVLSVFGRPRRMEEAKKFDKMYGTNSDLPYEARNILNLAVNHRIQSTAASIVNRSAIKLHENLKLAGIEAKLVLQVHDSLVIECQEKDAEDVALLMQDAMENTVDLKTIKFEAIPRIGKTLADV